MAESDAYRDLTNCPVCLEEYTLIGHHVPRMLPCYCTVCHLCLGKLIQDEKLVCPLDRRVHVARDQWSFPQNKYIIMSMKIQSQAARGPRKGYAHCQVHNLELLFLCTDKNCERFFCGGEYPRHRLHTFVTWQEELDRIKASAEALRVGWSACFKIVELTQVLVDVVRGLGIKHWESLKLPGNPTVVHAALNLAIWDYKQSAEILRRITLTTKKASAKELIAKRTYVRIYTEKLTALKQWLRPFKEPLVAMYDGLECAIRGLVSAINTEEEAAAEPRTNV